MDEFKNLFKKIPNEIDLSKKILLHNIDCDIKEYNAIEVVKTKIIQEGFIYLVDKKQYIEIFNI